MKVCVDLSILRDLLDAAICGELPKLSETDAERSTGESVCVSLCVHDNSKNNGSIHLKLEHTVVDKNRSDKFDTGHCPIKIKVTA